MKRAAFTILELVVVVVIVGILASLALPRFAMMIESSRGVEAVATISALRHAMERCYLMNNGSYAKCSYRSLAVGFPPDTLDVDAPNNIPNAHFVYRAEPEPTGKGYLIEAYRNTLELSGPWVGRSIFLGFGCKPTALDSGGATFDWPLDDKMYWSAHVPYKSSAPQ